jgi:phospholipase/carboxylesterase
VPWVPLTFTHKFVASSTEGLPTVLLLHGTGGDESTLLPLGRAIAPGAALLSPLGKVLENGRARFFRRFSERVFDLEDLRFRTDELLSFLREFGLDSPIVAIGYSVGANIAAHMMLRHPGVLAGAVLLRGMTPYDYEEAPDLSGTRVLISNGRLDPVATAEETERLFERFQACGADVLLHWHEGGHDVAPDDVREARRWFDLNFACR